MATTATDAQVLRMADLATDSPMPLLKRRRIIGERMMVSDIHLERGFRVQTHSHDNEQISIVLAGRIRFTLGDPQDTDRPEHVLTGGMAIVLPSNLPHAAEALEDTHILDLFSPPSAGTGIDQKK